MRVTVLRLGLAIHAMESSWMATPVAPEPLARGSTTTGFTHSPVHRPALRTTATESAGPSGTITVVPRPAAVVGTPVVESRPTGRTEKSVADTNDTVLSAELTTAITCPAELVCSSASLHPTAPTAAAATSVQRLSTLPPSR